MISTSITLDALRTEHTQNPIGIDVLNPRLSWQLASSERGARQSAYQIRVGLTERGLSSGVGLHWDSDKTVSSESTLQVYGGPALQSGQRYYWQVRVWDAHDVASAWSAVAFWEMGLLSCSDWRAEWIAPKPTQESSQTHPAPLLRKTFRLRRRISQARAYVTSLGLHEMYLNDRRVGDYLLVPGWTSYNKRLQYLTYDVTALLEPELNAVGIVLADGWYRGGRVGFLERANPYGRSLAALMMIRATYDNGEEEIIGTDVSWKSSTGPILASQIYDGESYDARLEKEGWATAEYSDDDWASVEVIQARKDTLIAATSPAVRRIESRRAVSVFTTPNGETVADFGQNMVGWVRLEVEGPSGTTIVLRHGEVLDRDGNLYTENLKAAKQEVRYTLRGQRVEVFEPHFTFQGFRYASVTGYPGLLTVDRLTGIVIHSDLERSGEFETSSDLINRLYQNVVWSQRGNFIDVPTDCPQRAERLGWTGDAQVFCPTAALNMNVMQFFAKWLADLTADQSNDGCVPWVIPDIVYEYKGHRAGGAAGWGDAATVIPWNLYQNYGDVRILERQYESMKEWVHYELSRASESLIWDGDYQFGDWLDFCAEGSDKEGATPPSLIATAYLAHSVELLARSARVLGKAAQAEYYSKVLANVAAAFCKAFVRTDGVVGNGTQTSYVLALDFDLLPAELRASAAAKLAQDVRERGHLTTGFLGTPRLLTVLSRYGYVDEAYRLLNREEFPSWLYPVRRGATTIWERWDGIKPDGSFQDKLMNSFNHYAYGAVAEWMYRVMAGIQIDSEAPGYRRILFEPQPGGGFSYVKAKLDTPYGRVSSRWSNTRGTFTLGVEVPPNTSAVVRLPGATLEQVTESGAPISGARGVSQLKQVAVCVCADLDSGRYEFTYPVAR